VEIRPPHHTLPLEWQLPCSERIIRHVEGIKAMATVTSAGSGHLRTSHTDGRINGSVSLGELLRGAREARGLTLERIAQETRIPQRHLEALEHGDLSAAPPGFYQRAELRAYARVVGLDTEVALAKLQSALKPVEAPVVPREVAKAGRSPRPQTLALIAVAVVAVSLAAAGLSRALVQPAPAPAVASDPIPAATPVVADRDGSPDAAGSTGNQPAQAAASAAAPDAAAQGTPAALERPAPVGSVTELVVTTTPAGARVTVNGIGWGVTPVTIQHMTPGDKRIRVSKEGYASQEQVLRIGEGQRQALDLQLDATP
jgi:cytoskeletal protein RodZ